MQKTDSHLFDAIQCILEVSIEPLSEYQLIKLLNEQGWSLPTNATDSLELFTSHFLVFNALYTLQSNYWKEQRYLEITALKIQLHPPVKQANNSTQLANYHSDKSLREYYLDMKQLESATEESVNSLLNSFWERFIATDDSAKALDILSLQPPVTYREIKQRYRSLAMKHHPDRDGNPADFQELNWAFGVLQRTYGKSATAGLRLKCYSGFAIKVLQQIIG